VREFHFVAARPVDAGWLACGTKPLQGYCVFVTIAHEILQELDLSARRPVDLNKNDSAMGAAVANFDWHSTSLGPIDEWPNTLRTAVGIMLSSQFPMALVWGEDLITLYNDAFVPILGTKPAALGRSFRDVWHEAWHAIGPIAARAFAGEAVFIEDFPLIVERRGFPEQAYFTFCYSPIWDEAGNVAGMLDTVVETTGKVESEKNARVVNQELAHRLQNTMAMIAAITDQTFRTGMSPQEMRTNLLQRINALGRAHSLLTNFGWTGAGIRDVIQAALEGHATNLEQISIRGPQLQLSPQHALALSLAVHELATNATKYGALSVATGQVAVDWVAADTDGFFKFTWIESQGPVVQQPARRGFGSRLQEEVIAGEFRGQVHIGYAPEGLRYQLTTGVRNLVGPSSGLS
jgi:two-component sensor histidine kinase